MNAHWQVNTGILFIRPSRALHAYILSQNRANIHIRCTLAVQDLMNSVMWGAFGARGFVCMPHTVHCLELFLLDECNPRSTKLAQYAGPRKPFASRDITETRRLVARIAEFNARYADWEVGVGGRAPVACWPGETCAAEVISTENDTRLSLALNAPPGWIVVTPIVVVGSARHDAVGTATGVIPCYYAVAPSNISAVRALRDAPNHGVMQNAARRFVFGGSASAWVDAASGGLVLSARRVIVAFDPASHTTALAVAAAMGEPAPTLVAATPSALLAWAHQHESSAVAVSQIVIVASAARLEAFCTPRMLAAWPRWLPLPVVWLPQDCDMSGVGALAAALAPCASELWAHPYVAARCGSHVVRPVPLMAVPELAVPFNFGSGGGGGGGVPRDIDIILLTANAFSRAACTSLSERAGDARSISCWDVGSVMTGRVPTVGELAAMVASARAVVVSYDAVRAPAGAEVGGLAPPPPPVVLSLARGGRRVVAWCVATLARTDVLCDVDAPPGAVLVVRSAEAAVAEAARIGGMAPDDAADIARDAAAFWRGGDDK